MCIEQKELNLQWQNILFTITMINTIYNMLCGLEIYEMSVSAVWMWWSCDEYFLQYLCEK